MSHLKEYIKNAYPSWIRGDANTPWSITDKYDEVRGFTLWQIETQTPFIAKQLLVTTATVEWITEWENYLKIFNPNKTLEERRWQLLARLAWNNTTLWAMKSLIYTIVGWNSNNITFIEYWKDKNYIIYINDTNWFLYKKNADNIDNWTAITSIRVDSHTVSPDWQYIVFRRASDWFLYKKNANDTSNWTAITGVNSDFPTYSPDWQYIVYRNNSDWFLYKKNAGDTSNWTAITSTNSNYPTYSPDWNYIVYTNITDWEKLYKKNAGDTSNWTAITGVNSIFPMYSPDWQYIIYEWNSDSFLYRKNSNDTENWIIITNSLQDAAYPNYSLDWQYIVYTDYNDWLLYKKIASNSENWTLITTWTDYLYRPVYLNPSESVFTYEVKINGDLVSLDHDTESIRTILELLQPAHCNVIITIINDLIDAISLTDVLDWFLLTSHTWGDWTWSITWGDWNPETWYIWWV